MNKETDPFVMFCNECSWRENTIGLLYYFCPICGHVNIGFSRIK